LRKERQREGRLTPDFNKDAGHRLARGNVEDLDVQVQLNASLGLNQVLANELSHDVVGTQNNLGAQNARGVGAKDDAEGSVQIVVSVGLVRGVDGSGTACALLALEY